MTLPSEPPKFTSERLAKGSTGWAVFGLQTALNHEQGAGLITDGVFGAITEAQVVLWQQRRGLLVDGIAGLATQSDLSIEVSRHTFVSGIPGGLARGLVESEGGYLLGAVNWGVSGGVDCGLVQVRVYGPPYPLVNLTYAFNASKSLYGSLVTLSARATDYLSSTWASKSWERQLRCAIMAHNWPSGGDAIAETGKCTRPDSPADWLPPNVKFPDGTPVKTRWEWCQFYAMGGPHGPARVPRYVTEWIVH